MKKDYSNKFNFFLKDGFSKELLEFIVSLDPGVYFNWFVVRLSDQFNSPEAYDDKLRNICLDIIEYFEKSNEFPNTKSPNLSFDKAVSLSREYKRLEKEYPSKVLYTFEDGAHIYLLPHSELIDESSKMSNCVNNYESNVYEKRFAILSLRDKNKKIIADIQIDANGCIAQNFEKANTQIKPSTWKYITEFFQKFEKKIDVPGLTPDIKPFNFLLEKFKIDIPSLSYGIPTSLKLLIDMEGKTHTKVETMQFLKTVDRISLKGSTTTFQNINEVINALNKFKNELNNAVDRLKAFALEMDGRSYFLNDEMKERIFGKDFYNLQGEVNSVNQVISSFVDKRFQKVSTSEVDLDAEEAPRERPIRRIMNPENMAARAVNNEADAPGVPDEEVRYRIIERNREDIDNLLMGRDIERGDDPVQEEIVGEEEIMAEEEALEEFGREEIELGFEGPENEGLIEDGEHSEG